MTDSGVCGVRIFLETGVDCGCNRVYGGGCTFGLMKDRGERQVINLEGFLQLE